MHTDSTTKAPSTTPAPLPVEAYYCSCPMPLAVERAERHGAAMRVCARCELPIAVTLRRG